MASAPERGCSDAPHEKVVPLASAYGNRRRPMGGERWSFATSRRIDRPRNRSLRACQREWTNQQAIQDRVDHLIQARVEWPSAVDSGMRKEQQDHSFQEVQEDPEVPGDRGGELHDVVISMRRGSKCSTIWNRYGDGIPRVRGLSGSRDGATRTLNWLRRLSHRVLMRSIWPNGSVLGEVSIARRSFLRCASM